MDLIAAVDNKWAIGYKGKLLFRIPDDMKRFKAKTIDKVVVMGRGTFASLPGSKPLAHRTNIVLSSSMSGDNEDVLVCSSLPELLKVIAGFKTSDIFVIGGESIYTQLLAYCSYAFITQVIIDCPADKYLHNLNEAQNWVLLDRSEPQKYNELQFCYLTYKNMNPRVIDGFN